MAEEATAAAKGAFKTTVGFLWNRVTPFKLSGGWATLGACTALVGAAWAFAPAAMATATGLGASGMPLFSSTAGTSAVFNSTAGAGANIASVAKAGLSNTFSAASLGLKKIGTMFTQGDWGQAFDHLKKAALALS